MKNPLHELTMYILIQSGFAVKDGFIYNTQTGEYLQYNNKMICYPAENFDGNVDVIPLDVSRSSKILDIIFAKYAENMARYEGVYINKWFISRTPGSIINVVYDDNGESIKLSTHPYKLDSIAYAEALAKINGIDDISDLIAINNAVEVI